VGLEDLLVSDDDLRVFRPLSHGPKANDELVGNLIDLFSDQTDVSTVPDLSFRQERDG
jgi:hypothetical protein